MGQVFVGDVGTIIYLETGVDLSAATSLTIRVRKRAEGSHNKHLVTWTGEVYNTTQIKYTIVEGDLDYAGVYSLQAYAELADWEGHGDEVELYVRPLV
jgi:hypothetical protein